MRGATPIGESGQRSTRLRCFWGWWRSRTRCRTRSCTVLASTPNCSGSPSGRWEARRAGATRREPGATGQPEPRRRRNPAGVPGRPRWIREGIDTGSMRILGDPPKLTRSASSGLLMVDHLVGLWPSSTSASRSRCAATTQCGQLSEYYSVICIARSPVDLTFGSASRLAMSDRPDRRRGCGPRRAQRGGRPRPPPWQLRSRPPPRLSGGQAFDTPTDLRVHVLRSGALPHRLGEAAVLTPPGGRVLAFATCDRTRASVASASRVMSGQKADTVAHGWRRCRADRPFGSALLLNTDPKVRQGHAILPWSDAPSGLMLVLADLCPHFPDAPPLD